MKRCLLVDDDSDDQELFQMAIDKIDPTIKCFYAIDGIDALEKLNNSSDSPPDIIFLDINMPRMGGLDFLRAIHGTSLSSIPTVIYSTSDEHFFKNETAQLGAVAYIVKSTTFASLVNDIKQALNAILELNY